MAWQKERRKETAERLEQELIELLVEHGYCDVYVSAADSYTQMVVRARHPELSANTLSNEEFSAL